jgi:hypothetical protein
MFFGRMVVVVDVVFTVVFVGWMVDWDVEKLLVDAEEFVVEVEFIDELVGIEVVFWVEIVVLLDALKVGGMMFFRDFTQLVSRVGRLHM